MCCGLRSAGPRMARLPASVALGSRGGIEALRVAQSGSLPFPVEQDEELLGALTVTVSPVEPLSPASQKLITDLATQTGLGLRFQRMKERALFARALASFLPPEVADLVEASPSALSLQEELEATIVFSDIRGFSSLAEQLEPREVAELVGRHLAAMVEVVTTHGGVVDKFTGDAVMAVFGAPRPAHDDARRALMCAADMQRRQLALNRGCGARRPADLTDRDRDQYRHSDRGDGRRARSAELHRARRRGQCRATAREPGRRWRNPRRRRDSTSRQPLTGPSRSVRLKIKGRKDLVDTYRIPWAHGKAGD